MQKWLRIQEFATQYQKFVYKVYSVHGQSYPCTYFNLDLPNSIYDGTVLDAGTYTKTGKLSGLKWRKILYLPAYFIEQIQPSFEADEEGYTKKNQVSAFSIPTEYNFQPSPTDFVKFEQDFLQSENNTHPLYQVTNIEKATNTEKTFWKLSLRVDFHREFDIDNHLSQVCIFFDYNKKTYEAEPGSFLFRLLDKNRNLNSIKNYFKDLSGLYLE